MTTRILLLLTLLSLFACQAKIQSSFYQLPGEDNTQVNLVKSYNKIVKKECRNPSEYIPDTNHLDFTPMRYVRVNVHWLYNADSTNNMDRSKTLEYTKGMLHAANYNLGKNRKMFLPIGNQTPNLPIPIRYVLTPKGDDPDDTGIYYHYDDKLCYYVDRGKNANNYNRDVIKKYGIGLDSVLNLFFLPHHPDSVLSKTYPTYVTGIALGTAIKIGGVYEKNETFWNFRGVINHEVGHIFGLSHAWTRYDGCDDTPPNKNYYSKTSCPNCDTLASNNMMDYNGYQNAVTPCQIGKMLYKMAGARSKQRKLLIKTWCQFKEDSTIIIQDSISWSCDKDVEGNIIIKDGASLRIVCRLAMPPGSKIIVEPGGKLILDDCRIHNDCGLKWQGIEVQKSRKKEGQIVLIGSPKLEDLSNTPIIPVF